MGSENGTRNGDGTRVVRAASYDPATEDPIPVVAQLLGAELDTEPEHLVPPLGAVVDGDRLAGLLADERQRESFVGLSFTYQGFRIVFDGPERICLLSTVSRSPS